MRFRVRGLSYTLSHTQHRCQTRNDTPVGVFSWLASFLRPTTRPPRNHTNKGVILCWVSFFSLYHTCRPRNDTPVGVVSWSASFLCPITRPPRNHTNKGVILCWASFFRSITHADHETTCPLVSSRGRHLSYALPHAHHETTPTKV